MDAMTDFTGGVSETYKLNEAPPQLFMTMLDAYQRQSLMCGVIAKSQKVRYNILCKLFFFIYLWIMKQAMNVLILQ